MKDTIVFDTQLKKLVSEGINNEKLKERVLEYIEVCKLKEKIAKEIIELKKENTSTLSYLDELEKDIKNIETELDEASKVQELLED